MAWSDWALGVATILMGVPIMLLTYPQVGFWIAAAPGLGWGVIALVLYELRRQQVLRL
jgi:hypothetical protein